MSQESDALVVERKAWLLEKNSLSIRLSRECDAVAFVESAVGDVSASQEKKIEKPKGVWDV